MGMETTYKLEFTRTFQPTNIIFLFKNYENHKILCYDNIIIDHHFYNCT